MIESLEIRNFRCFGQLSLRGLKRINIVVGRNGSGKTALLEAIFLVLIDSPSVSLRYRAQRGLGEQIKIGLRKELYKALWRDMFFNLDEEKPITVELKGPGISTRVTVSYGKELLSLPLGELAVESIAIAPIEFAWVGSDGIEHRRQVTLTPEAGLNFGPPVGPPLPSAFYSTSHRASVKESVECFSALSKRGEEGKIIEVIKNEFPFIEGLSIEVLAGQPMIHAKVLGVQEKLPLGLVSEGISRIMNILLGITGTARGGIILVDEVETGIYYAKFQSFWPILLRYSRENQVQVFVTIHSMEALDGVKDTLAENRDEFAIIRTERTNGESTARCFSGSELLSALRQEAEIR